MLKYRFRSFSNLSLNHYKNLQKQDPFCNIPSSIWDKVGKNLHMEKNHPLNIISTQIQDHFSDQKFQIFQELNPIVSIKQNFDDLLFPSDHPGRSKSDTYYVDPENVLRTHTSAHQSQFFQQNIQRALIISDVYRRDEIDSSHYPVFHQVEGYKIFDSSEIPSKFLDKNFQFPDGLQSPHENLKPQIAFLIEDLKSNVNSLLSNLFHQEKKLQIKWVPSYFPFTSPSFEVEIYYQEEFLEVLGCGIIQQEILDQNGQSNKLGWAFGMGLERLAMILFGIPDIRLFWSKDSRFLNQFKSGQIIKFKPFSKYPLCFKDISFWSKSETSDNDVYEIVRDIAGDLCEKVELMDVFLHPKTGKRSKCYRITYRSMERTFTNEEINSIQESIINRIIHELDVEIR